MRECKHPCCPDSGCRKKKEPKKRKWIKPFSEKRAEENILYHEERLVFLKANPTCEFPDCKSQATDVHHKQGRIGERLRDFTKCSALCRKHHRFITDHPDWAKENGFEISKFTP
jgi:hypothetical protein